MSITAASADGLGLLPEGVANVPYSTTATSGALTLFDNTTARACVNTVYGTSRASFLFPAMSEGWVHFNYASSAIAGTTGQPICILKQRSSSDSYGIRFPITSLVSGQVVTPQVSANNGSSWSDISASTFLWPSGSYARIDINFKLHATTGFLYVYINETLAYSYTGALQTATNLIDSIELRGSPFNVTAYWSEFLASSASTLGMRVASVTPNATGAQTDWSATYAAVDDYIYDPTDYSGTNTLNHISLFDASDLASAYNLWDVQAVVTNIEASNTGDSAINDVEFTVRIGATNYGVALSLAKDNTRQTKIVVQATSPASGNKWSISEVNNAQYGMKAV